MKTTLVFIVLIFVFTSTVFSQKSGIKNYHPLSGKIGISLEGGTNLMFSDFRDDGYDFTARLLGEYFFPTTGVGTWGIRLYSGGGYLFGSGGTNTRPGLESFKTPVLFVGGGPSFTAILSNTVMPYAAAGIAYLFYDPRDINGNRLERNISKAYSRHEHIFNGEIGVRFLISGSTSINFSGSINYINSDNLDDVVAGSDNDIFYSGYAGISLYVGGTRDSDEDGVKDPVDICPDTPKDVAVDEFGCPVDTDKDGVPDYIDECNDTPQNITVNTNGCPVDSDEDGVPDYLDLCKDTPENISVDSRGCPFDEDKDGVPDYKDQCPGTQIGVEVDNWGCQIKTEPVVTPEPKLESFVLTGGVIFDIGQSTLLDGAKSEIDNVIKVMKQYPETKWRIEGHTDSTGSYSRNKKLSLERANAVASYIIENGIDKSRLETVGAGPDKPVSDNSTATGRAMNRRVTIELTKEVK